MLKVTQIIRGSPVITISGQVHCVNYREAEGRILKISSQGAIVQMVQREAARTRLPESVS
jgi:hypothetical protein